MASAGTAYIDFAGRYDKLLAQSKVAGASAGANVTAGFASAFKKFAAPVAVAALGTAAFKLGETFKGAYNTLRSETGATGDSLKALQADFKAVAASRPTGFNVAAEAVATLNKRLGLTGEPLQELSKSILRMSGLTKTDLTTNLETVTRVFGDWGISVDQQTGKLDALFRASQATGPSVSRISELMVKYGAPLRQLGFDFDQTAALIGKFEKEGVNTQLVMGSMRVALGKLARSGEPVKETFERVVDEIANAGSVSEANAKALELFGARAGPDMAAAIREGRFELGSLFDAVANGSETIEKAATDTSTLAGKMGVLRNKVLVGMEPIATAVYDAINTGMANVVPIAGDAAGALGQVLSVLAKRDFVAGGPFAEDSPLIGGLFKVRDVVTDLAGEVRDFLLPIWQRVTDFVSRHASTAWAALTAVVTALVSPLVLGALWGLLGLIGGALAGIATALVSPLALLGLLAGAATIAYREFEPFREAVDRVRDALGGFVERVASVDWAATWGKITDGATEAVDWLRGTAAGEAIERGVRSVASTLTKKVAAVDWAKSWGRFNSPSDIRARFDEIDWAGVWAAVARNADGFWDAMWKRISNVKWGDGVWSEIVDAFRDARDFLEPMFESFRQLGESLSEAAKPAWDLVSALGTALAPLLRTVWPIVKALGIALGAVAYVLHKAFVFQIKAASVAVGFLARNVLPALTWFVSNVLTPVVSALVDYWLWAWGKVGEVVSWAWQHVIQPVWSAISTYVTQVLIPGYSALWDVVSVVWSSISGAITWAWGVISPVLSAIVGFIRDEVQWRFDALKTTAETVWTAVSGAVSDAWDVMSWIFQAIKDGIGGVSQWVGDKVDAIKGFFGGIGDGIIASFQGAFNAVARLWNNTVGKLSFKAPSWVPFGIGGKEWAVPDMPTFDAPVRLGSTPAERPFAGVFHDGGIVPGPRGAEMMAKVQAGELIIPADQVAGMMRGLPPSTPIEIPVVIDGKEIGRSRAVFEGIDQQGRLAVARR